MLRCPFCDADLGGGSARLRGGRCPQCSSILNWADDAASEAAPSADLAAAAQRAKAAPERDDDDAMSIKDIVHTIVSRGPDSGPERGTPGGGPFSGSSAEGAGR